MPREKVNWNISFLHILQKILAPFKPEGKRRTAYFEVRKAALQMLCRDFIKVIKLCLCTAPCTFVGAVVFVQVGFVPDLPILNVKVESIRSAFVIMAYNMLADNCPFMKILWRNSTVLFYLMLD